jgi:2-aminobenzoate-CoA ligase
MGIFDDYPPKELWPDFVFPEELFVPEEFNLCESLLDKHILEGRGEQTAIYYNEDRITFNELSEKVNRLGSSLLSIGVAPQDRVGIKLVNQPEALILIFAVQKIGAVPVLFSRLWSKTEDRYVMDIAKIRFFFASESLLRTDKEYREEMKYGGKIIVVEEQDKARESASFHSYLALMQKGSKNLKGIKVDKDALGLIMFTSGTTGMPKGCLHSVGSILSQGFLANKYVYKLSEGDILTGASPVAFAAGYCIFAVLPFSGRGAVSLIPKFDPKAVLETVQAHRATVLTGVPASYRRLLEYEGFDQYDLGSLRLCTTSADAIKETGSEWKSRTGLGIWEGYGSSEMFFLVTHNRITGRIKFGSVGSALPGWEIKIIDDEGLTVPPGEIGSLITKGPAGCRYLISGVNKEGNLKAQRKGVRDGWNCSGDMAYMDDEGSIFLVSREDDMIKTGGFRVYPAEIEEVLVKHPSVKEACVVGEPDDVRRFNVSACLVLEQDAEDEEKLSEELTSLCKEHVSIYKLPRSFQYVKELPRTATGKIMRSRVRHEIYGE